MFSSKVSREFGFTPISPYNRLSSEDSLVHECQQLEYKSPCQPFQVRKRKKLSIFAFGQGDGWKKNELKNALPSSSSPRNSIWRPPQKWECFFDGERWHKKRCNGSFRRGKNNCVCSNYPYGNSDSENDDEDVYADFAEMKRRQDEHDLIIAYGKHKIKMDPVERRLQRRFLKSHLGKGTRL